MSANTLELVVGTYEEVLLGYKIEIKDDDVNFEQSFTNHSHCGSIRCLATTSRYLVSGSADEMIKIINFRNRNEYGTLNEQQGTITCLEFYKTAFLFSGSDDGTICIWNAKNWACEKVLRGHKNGVTSISVHPSGKLALSVSKDRTLRTWNLIKGRSAYVTNIKTVADVVRWSPDGKFYAVAKNSSIDVYSIETAAVVQTIDFGNKILTIEFINEELIAVAGEGGKIEIFSHEKESIVSAFKAHDTRVKCLCCIPSRTNEDEKWLFSASNDGTIKIWKLQMNKIDFEPPLLSTFDSKFRITCMVVKAPQRPTFERNATEIVNENDQASETDELTENSQDVNPTKKQKIS